MMSKKLKINAKRITIENYPCPKKEVCNLLSKVAKFLFKIYHTVERFLSRHYEYSKRAFAFAKFTYTNYDFDFAFLFDLLAFKARRLEKCLKNGHAIQDKEDMEALKEFINLCDRLRDGNYEDKYHVLHDKKWGKLPPLKWKPVLDENGKPTGNSILIDRDRPKVKSKRDRYRERKEFLSIWIKREADRCADIDRMAEILKNHSTKWWD